MRRRHFLLAASAVLAATAATAALQDRAPALPAPEQRALAAAVANPARSEANRARDQYRKPAATLAFFGVRPRQTVVELFPGGPDEHHRCTLHQPALGAGEYRHVGRGQRDRSSAR